MLICGIPGKTRFTINGDDVRDEARRLGLVSISYHAQNRNRDIDECVIGQRNRTNNDRQTNIRPILIESDPMQPKIRSWNHCIN